ncbi:MAG: hypothetical protein U0792_00695 [Gemmataceae bacterium]
MKTRTTNRHTPTEPKPTNEEQRAAKKRYEILAGSELNRALWRVKEAAEQLETMIEDFEDSHGRDMTEVELANLGLDDSAYARWYDTTARDIAGFKWSLQMLLASIDPQGPRPAEADEPAVVGG